MKMNKSSTNENKVLTGIVGVIGLIMIGMYAPKGAISSTLSGIAFIVIGISGFIK